MSKSRVNEVLELAQVLISNGWTKNSFAKSKSGRSVSPESKSACRFCAVGAIERAAYDLGCTKQTQEKAKEKLRSALGWQNIAWINDAWDTKKVHMFDTFTLARLMP